MKKTIKTLVAAGLLVLSPLGFATSCNKNKYDLNADIAKASNSLDDYLTDQDYLSNYNKLSAAGKAAVSAALANAKLVVSQATDEASVAAALSSGKAALFDAVVDAVKLLCEDVRDGLSTDVDLAKMADLSDEAKADFADNIYPMALSLVTSARTFYGIFDGYSAFVKEAKRFVRQMEKGANGVYSYVAASYDVRMEIIAALEAYAMNNRLSGIPLNDDGGYALYSPDLKKGSDTYITGYGFGNISEGEIKADLATEENASWKRYYHTFTSSDDKTVTYANSEGSTVGTLAGHINGSYWGTRMNATKDGYEYYCSLAKSKPEALNLDSSTNLATKYRWKIRTGADGFKYNTNSTVAKYAAYNGRDVAAEDYLTTYKMVYTKKVGFKRGSEGLTGSGSIKGMKAYYDKSAEGYNESAWNDVGLKVYEESGESYMEVEFNNPCNQFFCIYYMGGILCPPLPESFVTSALGGGDWLAGTKKWGVFDLDASETPVDTTLSTSVYTLEKWVSDKTIAFKRNPYFTGELCGSTDTSTRYKIAGLHYNVLSAAKSDSEAGLNEFLAGKIHSVGVPSKRLNDFKDDPRAVFVPGGTSWKLNLNTCTQLQWNQLFGKNGSVYKHATEDKYYQCKPIMSDTNFYWGMFFSINRTEFADVLGCGPSITYFGDDYLGDPENGVVYNNSDAHKDAMESIVDIAEDGYSLETAKRFFKAASERMIKLGYYNVGDTVSIEMSWMSQSLVDVYGKPLANYFETAFNSCNGGLTLKVEQKYYSYYMDAYYAMMHGEFDIGYGSVSGNSYNPLNFMEVLKSDNSSGYTLNWGVDTSKVEVEYDGKLWSFDSLWQAGETGGYYENGVVLANYELDYTDDDYENEMAGYAFENEDGSVTLSVATNMLRGHEEEGLSVDVSAVTADTYVAVAGADGKTSAKYKEFKHETGWTLNEKDELSFVLPAEEWAQFKGNNNYYGLAYAESWGGLEYLMLDVTFAVTVKGVTTENVASTDFLVVPLSMQQAE